MMESILGIDLGTTNSVVAIWDNGQPRVVASPETGEKVLPSVVGLDPSGQILVGTTARNQGPLYPDRTIRSVKRHMGRDVQLALGDRLLSPPEVSALILRELQRWAAAEVGHPVTKAVITVPAFFSDSQREATRLAGELAGLEVVRIINEPTAASLVYHPRSQASQRVLVYDLGGGTFDVSIVQLEQGIVEVLASHGDTHLGGDDFDKLLSDYLISQLPQAGGNLEQEPAARARLLMAAEEAKKELSFATFAPVREEFLLSDRGDGQPLHLDVTLERDQLEKLIEPLLERTISCVDQALADARMHVGQVSQVVLVGGSTRIPRVGELLQRRLNHLPESSVDPDLCVAIGAAIQGALIAGHDVNRVLVDIVAHSVGVRVVGDRRDYAANRFATVIPRGTALPATRAQTFYTVHPGQTEAEIEVFQGESDDVRLNERIGAVMFTGIKSQESNVPLSVQFTTNLNGLLEVHVTDRTSGRDIRAQLKRGTHLTRWATATAPTAPAMSRVDGPHLDQPVAQPHENLGQAMEMAEVKPVASVGAEQASRQTFGETEVQRLSATVGRVAALASDEDRAELEELLQQLQSAADSNNDLAYASTKRELEELIYYLDED